MEDMLPLEVTPKEGKSQAKLWTTVDVKKVNDVTRLQALVDKKKRTSWNGFSSSMASAVICLSTGQVGKGFSRVDTPLFEGMLVVQEVSEGDADEVNVKDVNAGDVVKGDVSVANDEVPTAAEESSIPSPKPPTPPSQPSQDIPFTSQDKIAQALKITKLKQRVKKLERRNKVKVLKLRWLQKVGTRQRIKTSDDTMMDDVSNQGRMIAEMDVDADVVLEETKDVTDDIVQDAHVKEKAKSKDKGKGILVEEPKPLKKKPQTEAQARRNMMIYLRNVDGFKMDYFKGMSYDDIRPIFEAKFNSNVDFLQKTKEQINEEESRALKRINETLAEKAAKRQKLDKEVEELKRHLQIVPNEEDDVYTEATPLALKVPVVDYEIYNENNKPYYKIKRADGSHQLYLSFLSLLRNFDREDLEALWRLVKERIATTKPKNFSDDFLMITLRAMFEKPDIHAQIWKNQRSVHGQAKIKNWKLLESCGVQIITFTTTQLILLVERKYPLTKFTLNQMLNNMRLKFEEESEVSLELLMFIRQQHQEGAQLE
nr:hypothetical protein [Tanacetum cinerariifolium]